MLTGICCKLNNVCWIKKGFTLIELLIYLAIVSSLLIMSIVFGQVFFQRNQIDVVASEINNAIHYARNMAMIHGVPVALNPIDPLQDWTKGMVLFIDNKEHHYTEKDKLLYQWQWKNQGIRIAWDGFRSNEYLVLASNLNQAACSGSFHLMIGQKDVGQLIINRLGHVQIQNKPTLNPSRDREGPETLDG